MVIVRLLLCIFLPMYCVLYLGTRSLYQLCVLIMYKEEYLCIYFPSINSNLDMTCFSFSSVQNMKMLKFHFSKQCTDETLTLFI